MERKPAKSHREKVRKERPASSGVVPEPPGVVPPEGLRGSRAPRLAAVRAPPAPTARVARGTIRGLAAMPMRSPPAARLGHERSHEDDYAHRLAGTGLRVADTAARAAERSLSAGARAVESSASEASGVVRDSGRAARNAATGLTRQLERADEMSLKSAVAANACMNCPGQGIVSKVPLQFPYPTGTVQSRLIVNISSKVTALAGPNIGLYDTAVLIYPGMNAKVNTSGTVSVGNTWTTFTNITDPIASQVSTLAVGYLTVGLGVRVAITTSALNRGGAFTAQQYPGLVGLATSNIPDTLNIGGKTVTATDMNNAEAINEFVINWDAANITGDMEPLPMNADNLDGPIVLRFVSATAFTAVLTIDSTYELVPSVLGANVIPVTEYSGDPGDLAKVRAIIDNSEPIGESMGPAGSRAREDASMKLLEEVDALPGPPPPSVTGTWGDEVDTAAHLQWCASGMDANHIPEGSFPPNVRAWWAKKYNTRFVDSAEYLRAKVPDHPAFAARSARASLNSDARDARIAIATYGRVPPVGGATATPASAPPGWEPVSVPRSLGR